MKKKGKLQIYCFECNKYYIMDDEQFNWTCPRCHSVITRYRCTRCGYQWYARSRDKLPDVCGNPKCHSPYWDRERVKDKKVKG